LCLNTVFYNTASACRVCLSQIEPEVFAYELGLEYSRSPLPCDVLKFVLRPHSADFGFSNEFEASTMTWLAANATSFRHLSILCSASLRDVSHNARVARYYFTGNPWCIFDLEKILSTCKNLKHADVVYDNEICDSFSVISDSPLFLRTDQEISHLVGVPLCSSLTLRLYAVQCWVSLHP